MQSPEFAGEREMHRDLNRFPELSFNAPLKVVSWNLPHGFLLQGGGVYIQGGHTEMDDCTIHSNTAVVKELCQLAQQSAPSCGTQPSLTVSPLVCTDGAG